MINKTFLALSLLILGGLGSQAEADWVMDFGPGLSSEVTSFSLLPGSNFTGALDTNHTTGHTWTLDGAALDPDRTANIRYEFPSLVSILSAQGAGANQLLKFAVPLGSNSSDGVFSVVGTAERVSGGSYTFTDDSGGTPDDPNGDFEWITSITMADLAADDIVALNFEITYDFTGGLGFPQTFTFGGPGGLIAAPEPTSAAMIGCALVGLIARRRRKA